jgi:hypothetical protein
MIYRKTLFGNKEQEKEVIYLFLKKIIDLKIKKKKKKAH